MKTINFLIGWDKFPGFEDYVENFRSDLNWEYSGDGPRVTFSEAGLFSSLSVDYTHLLILSLKS